MTPQAFLQAVRAFDPLLDVRWGPSIGRWVVERKAIIPDTEFQYLRNRLRRVEGKIRELSGKDRDAQVELYKELSEEWTSMGRGCRVIFFRHVLTDLAYNHLCEADIKRYGGYSRYADELETEEGRREAALNRAQAIEREAINREAFSVIDFLERRCQVPMQHGERSLQKLLS